MTRYKSVSIPEKLHEWVSNHVEEQGYTSVPDLVKTLLRDWVKEVEKQKQMQKAAQPFEKAFVLANKGEYEKAGKLLKEMGEENEEPAGLG